ncbi:MAG: hypothetical protein LCH46_05750 [Proteobacteria bacterium]|nr:hypothetical protein [Pseudomonadota bacterium]
MNGWTLSFLPLVPLWLLWTATAIGVIAVAAMLRARMRGAGLRGLGLLLLLAVLANPQLSQEERQYLPDVVAVILDESESQAIADRRSQTELAFNELRARLEALGDVDIRVGRTVQGTTPDTDGTRVFTALSRIMADIPPERFGGAFLISDGQIHDVPAGDALADLAGPIHTLLSGHRNEIDRRVAITRSPRFAITGQEQTVSFKVEETPAGTAPIDVTIRLPNGDERQISVMPNSEESINVTLDRAGQNIIEIAAAAREGEITLSNNRALATIQGIRDRLRVLLVSGEPHPGERTWRNLLKADAAVDLVHFTILRPPEKQDGTPTRELSLIAFPTRELFIDKINEFDLVIFDRYRRQTVLPDSYLANVADYVRRGGAVLISSGPDYADEEGLAGTPLIDVLAASPTGSITETPFKPQLTDLGKRHPVTRNLPGENNGSPSWGRWFRLIDTDVQNGGTALMQGPDGKPLLVLAHAGEGRVAQFLSDQGWLWARGYEGGGPQVELLRRIAHWLMKEPDLEEEALLARQQGNSLLVERRTLADTAQPVEITAPSGEKRSVTLQAAGPGIFSATVPASETGLYALANGDKQAFAIFGQADSKEASDVRATAALVQPVAEVTRGGIGWIEDGLPRITTVRQGSLSAGSGWMGVTSNEQFRVTAVRETPLFSTLASLALLLTALSLMWYREGR